MPQFDFYSFATQTFWILAFLGLFYFFVLFFYLSHYAEVLKFRKNLIVLGSYSNHKEKIIITVFDFYINFFIAV